MSEGRIGPLQKVEPKDVPELPEDTPDGILLNEYCIIDKDTIYVYDKRTRAWYMGLLL